jgi:L-ribulose-5-phosphate 4-epimerase
VHTWGNASAIDRAAGVVVIKPSGMGYGELAPEQMVVCDLDGKVLEGVLKPSVDLQTHLALYHAFEAVGGIVHTHSHFATCFAQARQPIPCLGTTHADYFYGEVPLADSPNEIEAGEEYERWIGEEIVRRYEGLDPLEQPAVLAAGHAPFAWGRDIAEALHHAAVLEEVARMAYHTLLLNPETPCLERHLLERHFLRKHGAAAYYGQR